jgi:hypothetical protein
LPPPATVRTSTTKEEAVAVGEALALVLWLSVPVTLGVGAAEPPVGEM